jgi:glycyl-tRNA synthetase beta chain
MSQLLLELFSEEIPARLQPVASDDLKRLVSLALKEAGLDFSEARAFATPRRLTLVIDDLPDAQPDISEEKRGPRTDAPDRAIEGFLKANNVTLDQCEKRVAGKGEFWFAVIERKGRKTAEVLTEILPDLIRKLPWRKSMRWGTGSFRWVRPLQRILCVFDGHPLDFEVADGIPCGNITSGHRFLGPEPFQVAYFDGYEKTLQLNKVILNPAIRRDLIRDDAKALAEGEGLTLKRDPELLTEVVGLVEWPVVLMGKIDPVFMELPDEVLTTSMRSHQKYFSVLDKDGRLAPRFIVVANIESSDGGAAILAGNERVLRARLADAKFFWDQDRKQSLESRLPALGGMVFHTLLGTLEDKVMRMTALAAKLAETTGADRDLARSAAMLAKADLTTGMVGEFPELQGIMGRYYALEEGEKPEIAVAIAEHYAPKGPDDFCPSAPVSLAVSIADKIDTLAGFWAIDETPTGSRDPFALRRAALGIIRMVLENNLTLNLRHITGLALAEYRGQSNAIKPGDDEVIAQSVWDFFVDRLKVHLRGQGVRHDLISAVFSTGSEGDLLRLVQKAEALKSFLDTEDGANLLTAYRRANNIVAIEEKKDNEKYRLGTVNETLFKQPEERELWSALTLVEQLNPPNADMTQFAAVLNALSQLREPVDAFFDKVTVNVDDDPDLRKNRLHLLSEISMCMNRVADFSEIEG